ncbi:hypothetical protein BG011_008484 [Mortierella polycephala]|uniref:Uncharacterized protein n=1 Tax=Mortierella polycephala TaxID=41804 RepID=A0A9P6TXK4_9FUNG|nr:hypothetical protein BG011_008484 [Mortierella polycephala]
MAGILLETGMEKGYLEANWCIIIYDAFEMMLEFNPLKRTCLGLFHKIDLGDDLGKFELK